MSRSPTAARIKAEQDKKSKQVKALRDKRIQYLKTNILDDLKTSVRTASIPDQIDMAFGIERHKVVAELLREMADELDKE